MKVAVLKKNLSQTFDWNKFLKSCLLEQVKRKSDRIALMQEHLLQSSFSISFLVNEHKMNKAL